MGAATIPELEASIAAQRSKIKDLKASNADPAAIKDAVAVLVKLKQEITALAREPAWFTHP